MDKLNIPFDHLAPVGFVTNKAATGTDSATGAGFGQALANASNATLTNKPGAPGVTHTIAPGETLTSIVRQTATDKGIALSPDQSHRMALDLASRNGISDPNRIQPGQSLQLGSLVADLQATATPTAPKVPSVVADTTRQWMNSRQASASPEAGKTIARAAALPARPQYAGAAAAANGHHPVLKQTLDRAVAKGFIPGNEKNAVYNKILDLSEKHKFAPDDFARLSLMESDGLNPKATNQRCHGIIQFCDGPARGAATAGYAKNPKAILNLSVHSQLDLVDKYFDEVGLKNKGPAGLEDLYLSVLNPASRSQSSATTPLNIPGPQARDLHVGRDTDNPITRQSIRFGLLQNAAARLRDMVPGRVRVAAQGAMQYADTQAN
jgi:LysM repeat protein